MLSDIYLWSCAPTGATLAAAEAFGNNSNNFTDFSRTLFYLIFVEHCLNFTSSLVPILLSRRRPLSKKKVSILIFFFYLFFLLLYTASATTTGQFRHHKIIIIVSICTTWDNITNTCWYCSFLICCNTSSPKRPPASYIASGRCLISASGQP